MNSVITSDSWFVIFTRPKFEKKVERELLDSGIDCFLPLVKAVHQWSDRKKIIEKPLFPNYIFVKNTLMVKSKVLSINGVIKFLSCDGRPSILTDKVVASIRKMLPSKPILSEPVLQVGDKALINQGPMKGLSGNLIVYKGQCKLAINVDIMNRAVVVDVPVEHIEKFYHSDPKVNHLNL